MRIPDRHRGPGDRIWAGTGAQGASAPLALLCLLALHGAACAATSPAAMPAPAPPVHRVQQADTRAELRITREQAAANAVRTVPGEVTSVDLERKLGRVVWVVEVQTPAGDETDVLIDVETGEVLGTE